MGNPVVHFEIAVSDLQKGRQFYGNLFDWKIRDCEKMPYCLIDTGSENLGGGLFQVGELENYKPYATFYVEVENVAAYLEKAAALGAKPVVPPTDISGGTFALFLDPDDNLIGLWKNASEALQVS